MLLEWAGLDLTPEELYAKTTALQEEMWKSVKPLPGAEQLIRSLVAHNIPIAVSESFVMYLMVVGNFFPSFKVSGKNIPFTRRFLCTLP